ncbi:hypothetical protein ND861_07030 [Leptospira sp. 2 VSF19]|uniref:Uncharacterized protein n=1 Tax=Leptospira soteropolitanensis TaxID=2950025 RepID=A0AAW5VEV8_9LEPT|nr:hypothetical protein [Leptospira soteropolitanensis]MCW7494795.1 hypothetical protein [Leptospira soteropolitanensis]MCW7499984.1 hypothetical protein [Leptospira soteropolitanensis]MCW7522236.1 hypothetical protein [Leptospira soteropolitanensis]MCW7526091.1 hypothetical protein [Leptospira soteropolitanensis]MCW7529797.1 hypothetical protein [Leptospira soteropolitanensis]
MAEDDPNNLQKESKNFFLEFLQDKLNHPYIGTFVLSFYFYNFEDLTKLFIGLGEEFTEDKIDAIEIFVSNFHFWSCDFWLPVLSAITIPNIIYNAGKIIFDLCKDVTEILLSRIRTWKNRKVFQSNIDNLEFKNNIKSQAINNLRMNTFSIMLDIIEGERKNTGIPHLYYFGSLEKFKEGELVSHIKDRIEIGRYNKKFKLLGVIKKVLVENVFIVEVLNTSTLRELIKNKFDVTIDTSHAKEFNVFNEGEGKLEYSITKIADYDKNFVCTMVQPSFEIYNENLENKIEIDINRETKSVIDRFMIISDYQ